MYIHIYVYVHIYTCIHMYICISLYISAKQMYTYTCTHIFSSQSHTCFNELILPEYGTREAFETKLTLALSHLDDGMLLR